MSEGNETSDEVTPGTGESDREQGKETETKEVKEPAEPEEPAEPGVV